MSQQFRRKLDGTLESLPACAMVTVEAGETIVSVSCGGGGYGPAEQREPARVAHDVAERWISAERARTVYGARL